MGNLYVSRNYPVGDSLDSHQHQARTQFPAQQLFTLTFIVNYMRCHNLILIPSQLAWQMDK